MDSAVRVVDTDEDELVDIENNDATIKTEIPDNDVTITDFDTTRPNSTKRKSHIGDNLQLFKQRSKILKTSSKEPDSLLENDLTKWWKSASEFRRPPSNESSPEAREDEITLNPLLRLPNCNLDPCESKISAETKSNDAYWDKNGEIFIPPTQERSLPLGVASENEWESFPDFFSGKTKYSPEKYLVIRDSIIKLWLEQKPRHVNKVMLRPILKKSCGNVNNIGKIHRYLESIGAINFGSDLVWWKQMKRKDQNDRSARVTTLSTDDKLRRALDQRMRGRNKMSSTLSDQQDDAIGGYTIDHEDVE